MKRDEFGFVLPNLYYQFLSEWEDIDPMKLEIQASVCMLWRIFKSVMRLIRLRK